MARQMPQSSHLVPEALTAESSQSEDSEQGLISMRNTYKPVCDRSNIVTAAAGLGGLSALVILGFSAAYTAKPGPIAYYNFFTPIHLAACLVFEALELYLLARSHICRSSKRIIRTFRAIYWAGLSVTSCISFIGYAARHLAVAVVCQLFAFTLTLCALWLLWRENRSRIKREPSKWYIKAAKGFNILLKIIHWCFAVLFAAGTIILCLQYKYRNPGEIYQVSFTSGGVRNINVYCTSTTSKNGSSLPTIWFLSDMAHGITDALGLQTYLETVHGRNSCSLDPPGFGWSQPSLKDYSNSSDYFVNLLSALGREDDPVVYAGWGGGGEDALAHALETPHTTKGLVLLDVYPDGIEWEDMARNKSWNPQQMLAYRKLDLEGRITLVQIILTIGFTWGLIPIFIPSNSTEYFEKSLYPRHRAQSLKPDMWTSQYYELQSEYRWPGPSTFLTNTTLPSTVPVYAIATRNPNTADPASNNFTVTRKIEVAQGIAGRNETVKGWIWCEGDCDQGFPVSRARWTADMLVELGV